MPVHRVCTSAHLSVKKWQKFDPFSYHFISYKQSSYQNPATQYLISSPKNKKKLVHEKLLTIVRKKKEMKKG